MKFSSLLLLAALLLTSNIQAQKAETIIADMIEALGGKDAFYNKGSVSYDYNYHNPNAPMTLAGKETYVFDGEKSTATYTKHSLLAPKGGKVVEGYDGNSAWVKVDGKLVNSDDALGVARFLRKTNYYWFTMFFKLQDEGVNLAYKGEQQLRGHMYDLVQVTFGDKVGDGQDTYLLYVNKRTKLVDQFLFTVVGFGLTDPSLMCLTYQDIDGIKVATERSYIDADWKGNIKPGVKWTTTYWDNVTFGVKPAASVFMKSK